MSDRGDLHDVLDALAAAERDHRSVRYWAANAAISGLFSVDGSTGNLVPDDSAYGIDIKVQSVDVSPDWDLVSLP